MSATDADLPRALRDALLACDEFADDATLRALCATAPDLAHWRDRLPTADTRAARVARVTAFLLDQPHAAAQPPALSLLLRALSAQRDTTDAQHALLADLAERVAQAPDRARDDDAPTPGESPYKGLAYFDEPDAALFFGREALTAELLARLSLPDQRFLAVVGASGSGKSSLVRAGLVHALRMGALADSARWAIHVITPTAHPLEALAATLTRDVESVTAAATLMDDLAREARSLHLAVRRTLERVHAPRLVLVVDQFEETFTACKDEAERRAFLDALMHASAPETAGPTLVVLTLRADFYAHCAQHARLWDVLEHQQKHVQAMTQDELRRAIEAPARDWDFEPGLVDLLLHDVGTEPGALPLLAHALLETWQRRTRRTLTLAGYQASGGVRGAIAQTAERVYAALTPDAQAIARGIFLRLTELGEGAQDTRRRALLTELAPRAEDDAAVSATLKTLADARLITTDTHTAEVSHEALIREWGRLRGWLDEDRDGLRLHHHLSESAHEWVARGRDASELYRGARLAQVREWAAVHGDGLNAVEREFLEASQADAAHAAAEHEAQQARELEAARRLAEESEARRKIEETLAHEQVEAARHLAAESESRRQAESARAQDAEQSTVRLRTRNRIAFGSAAVALLLALIAFTLFIAANQAQQSEAVQRGTAQAASTAAIAQRSTADAASTVAIAQRATADAASTSAVAQRATAEVASTAAISESQRARAGELAGQATGLLAKNFGVALLLSVESSLRSDTSTSRATLLDSIRYNPIISQTRWLTSHTGSANSVAFSPDGQTLAAGSGDNTIILWDVATRLPIGQPLTGHINSLYTDSVESVAFSPDGQILASGSSDTTIILWDVATRLPIGQPLTGHTNSVESVAFSPDGQTLASGSADSTIILWDVATRLPIGQPLAGHTSFVNSVAFSPDGQTLASASCGKFDVNNYCPQGEIILWDVATRSPIGQPITGHTSYVTSVAFSPALPDGSTSGQTLASASVDGTIILWNVAMRLPIGQPLTNHTNSVNSVAFSPDGQTLASASADGTIILWNVATRLPIGQPLTNHTNSVNSVAFSPDGQTLASGSSDTTIILWDVATRLPIGQPLTGHTRSVYNVAFSPDGQTLASASGDTTIILWDVATRLPIGQPLTGHTRSVYNVAFSPDGQTLASTSRDGTIILWNVATRLPIQTLIGHTRYVYSVAFSPVGQTLASAGCSNINEMGFCTQGEIILWDVAMRLPIGWLPTVPGNYMSSVAFSPDGQILASGSANGTIILWNVATRLPIGQPLTGHANYVSGVAFSPDGQILASASGDTTIILWNVATRLPIGQPLTGYTSAVNSVAFSPDGQILASGSANSTIILWDVATRLPIGQTLTGHTSAVNSVAFSPALPDGGISGQTLVLGSEDGTILLWDVSIASWRANACDIVGRNLTRAEWSRYLYDRPYPTTSASATCPQWPLEPEPAPTPTGTP